MELKETASNPRPPLRPAIVAVFLGLPLAALVLVYWLCLPHVYFQ